MSSPGPAPDKTRCLNVNVPLLKVLTFILENNKLFDPPEFPIRIELLPLNDVAEVIAPPV